MAAFKEHCVLGDMLPAIKGVQPHICHRFKDILDQRIVTLTLNLSRSSKVKTMGTLYNLR